MPLYAEDRSRCTGTAVLPPRQLHLAHLHDIRRKNNVYTRIYGQRIVQNIACSTVLPLRIVGDFSAVAERVRILFDCCFQTNASKIDSTQYCRTYSYVLVMCGFKRLKDKGQFKRL